MSALDIFMVGMLKPLPHPIYPGLIASAIFEALRKGGRRVAHRQSEGMWCVHQMWVELDGQKYRILVMPEDTPVSIGDVPADQHFLEPPNDDVGGGI